MEVLKYLETHSFADLNEEYGIKVKLYEKENLAVLNYCQIKSPKTHPITIECRGLILDYAEEITVVCRPFDRFFNAGECPELVEDFDITRATAYEKVDGSLIKVYYWNDKWRCATRGTAFAECKVNGFNATFADLVHRAIGVEDALNFHRRCDQIFDKRYTYLFEVTSLENLVVRRYEGTKLWYLGCRHTTIGSDHTAASTVLNEVKELRALIPQQFKFNTLLDALDASRELKNLDEGYVLFDKVTHKRIKVKSPAYVAVHLLRGDGLNPKRIRQLVISNEQEEYLKYYPEDDVHITPVLIKLKEFVFEVATVYIDTSLIKCQKEFALKVKDFPFSGLLFTARKLQCNPIKVWQELTPNQQLKLFDTYLGE